MDPMTSPGLYASRCLSFFHIFGPLRLMVKSSASALAATASHSDGLCSLVASKNLEECWNLEIAVERSKNDLGLLVLEWKLDE